MSKVDPTEFKNLDRRSTILLQAARKQTEGFEEKSASGIEDPGIDALRGSFGTVGSIIRARSARRVSQSSRGTAHSSRFGATHSQLDVERDDQRNLPSVPADLGHYGAMKRHQLFDPPVPHLDIPEFDAISMSSQPSAHKPTIKFGEQDVVHSYHRGTTGRDDLATHERRAAPHGTSIVALPSSYAQSAPPGNTRDNMPAQRQFPESPTSTSGHRFRHDPETSGLHSAPPRIGVSEGPYLDPYVGSSVSATLPSFRSAISLDDDTEPQRQQHRRISRQTSSRDYPKVDAEDAEERMSLWDPQRDNSSEVDVAVSLESPPGTIRLVSSRGGNF
jgi:magnesium transporter